MARTMALPLADDGSARFLLWLIGLMAYLAAVAIGSAFAVGSVIDRWDAGVQGSLTVQLPRPGDGAALPSATLDAALRAVRATAGVAAAEPLDPDTQARLLRPWLGEGFDTAVLPLPALVDVRLAPGATVDTAVLGRRLGQIVPGATVESHGTWLDRLFRAARLIQWVSGGIVVLIASAAVVTVVFTTRTGLLLHVQVVNLLHLMGAPDAFVARQFQWHAFRLGLRGGAIGLVMALLTLGALKWAAERAAETGGMDLLPGFRLPLTAWIAVLALPPVMGVVGLLTARITVLRVLARMP